MRAWSGVTVALAIALSGCGQAAVSRPDAGADGGDGGGGDAAVAPPAAVDDIYGVSVPRANAWWVDDAGRIHRGAERVILRGVNWFGLETGDRALHGLWSGRSVASFLDQITDLGFNALRVPLSPEAIRPGFVGAPWSRPAGAAPGPPPTGREHLEDLLAASAERGLYVLLDLHTCDPAVEGGLAGAPDDCPGYDLADWHGDLAELARLADAWPHVVGVDLFNEPHALTWATWRALAESAAEVVLTLAPRTLVFVEGVGAASPFGDAHPFWGANLTEAGDDPPAIPRARLVLSPHVYGPGVHRQAYFDDPTFPANLPAIWERHFGYLRHRGFAVVVGEWGGFYDDARSPGEVAWNDAFVAWLASWGEEPPSFFYWALNPNSADTGGLLADDWQTPVPAKRALLRPLLEPAR